MAIKTELDLAALTAILAPFDLRPRRARGLEAGTVNSNYRVETDGGVVFVRVNEGKSEPDVRYESELLWHLAMRRFSTPQPLRRRDGTPYIAHAGKLVTVYPWVPAGHHREGSAIGPAEAARVGRLLAQLHNCAADFVPRREGIYTLGHIKRRIEGLRGEPRVAKVLPTLDEELEFLAESRAATLPSGTIHGDLFPDNVLWISGRRAQAGVSDDVVALDFEQASHGRYAYDLAVTLLAWCWSGADLDDARAQAMVAAYQQERPLDALERESFLVEARAAALRFTVTRITDVFLPSLPGAEELGKDYRDYLSRLERLRASLPGRAKAWCIAAVAA